MNEQSKPFPFELDPVIEFYKTCIDQSVLEENLKLTVEERFEKLMRLQMVVEEFRKAGINCG